MIIFHDFCFILKGSEREEIQQMRGEEKIIQNSEQLNRSFKSYNNLQYPKAGDDIGSQEQKLRIQNVGIFCRAYRSHEH